MSPYEMLALREIESWKNPQPGWFGKTMAILNWPIEKAGDAVMSIPGVGWVIEKAVGGLVNLTNEAAQWSVRSEAIFSEYREGGHSHIRSHHELASLDLEHADRMVGWLGAKYKGLATVEGATTGVLGLPGIPPDIVALVAMNLRAIGEYATYYGFDVTLQQERLFAMNVLGFASSPNDSSKAVAMAQLVRIAQDVAKKNAWKDLEKYAFVQVIQRIAKALGIRLTKAKLAQAIPYTGAVVGGGFNAYFTAKVCETAYHLYRERFLARKHGPAVISARMPPANELDPRYAEHEEHLPHDRSPPPSL